MPYIVPTEQKKLPNLSTLKYPVKTYIFMLKY